MASSANLFTSAKVVPAKAPKEAKSKKHEVEIKGLKAYAKIVAAEKAIQALKETYRVQVDAEMRDVFALNGRTIKRQPENFVGTEGGATSSCEMRKRSSASVLTPEQIALTNKFGIETVEVEDQIEAFIFNPAYKDDQAMLEKISKALAKVPGLPTDLIMKQEGSKKTITTDKSIDQVFALDQKTTPIGVTKMLMEVVGTFALKPKVAEFDAAEVLKDLAELVAETKEEDEDEE